MSGLFKTASRTYALYLRRTTASGHGQILPFSPRQRRRTVVGGNELVRLSVVSKVLYFRVVRVMRVDSKGLLGLLGLSRRGNRRTVVKGFVS